MQVLTAVENTVAAAVAAAKEIGMVVNCTAVVGGERIGEICWHPEGVEAFLDKIGFKDGQGTVELAAN